MAPLVFCETVTALALLAPGGSFVLKLFTLFEHSSACLLFLLVCTFQVRERPVRFPVLDWSLCSRNVGP